MLEKLKNCPFCGSKATLTQGLATPIQLFECSNKDCGAVVSFNNLLCNLEKGFTEKVKHWNRRADDGKQ